MTDDVLHGKGDAEFDRLARQVDEDLVELGVLPTNLSGSSTGLGGVGMRTVDRYITILAEHDLTPFYREPWINPRTWQVEPGVLGERPDMRWRVSADEWNRLLVHVETTWLDAVASPTMAAQLFGWPIEEDETLPPNSIIFEPSA